MNMEDEEKFLKHQLIGARDALREHQSEDRKRRLKENMLESNLEIIEQAIKDYMEGNWLVETDHFILSTEKNTHIKLKGDAL